MALVVVTGGKIGLVTAYIPYLKTLRIRLFQNDHVPTAIDVVGAYTEANFNGYASILTNNWGPAFVNGGFDGETDEVNRTFTATNGAVVNTIYGYYFTDPAGNLIYAERNPAGGYVINAGGQTYTVLPRLVLTDF
jgi:hypothetical protein